MKAPLKLSIERHGQPYYDELVFLNPNPESPCEAAVREVFKRRRTPAIVIGFNRIPLNWNKGKNR